LIGQPWRAAFFLDHDKHDTHLFLHLVRTVSLFLLLDLIDMLSGVAHAWEWGWEAFHGIVVFGVGIDSCLTF